MELTKRTYLGEGYLHRFKNNITGEEIYEECTKEQYEALGVKGGWKNNPVKDGWTWIGSCGGTIKVDTPDTVLGINEYCELPDRVVVNRGKGIENFTKKRNHR